MFKERFIFDIPDEFPRDFSDPDVDEEEVKKLYGVLSLKTAQNQRARQLLFDDYRVVTDPASAPVVRMNILVQYALGVLTEHRMKFEIRWADIVAENIVESRNEAESRQVRQRGVKELHLPGGGVHEVLPMIEEVPDGP